MWKLNTSSRGKFEEFKRLFAQFGIPLEVSHIDLKEIEASPVEVIAHKASQLGENILVEDTSLEIEGASVGINVRWLLDHLADYEGRKAEWTVLLAFRQGDRVFIYKAAVPGTIVEPRGASGFGFDPVFLPNGATQTLAESKPDAFNARAKAVKVLMQGNIWATHPVIEEWEGPWQKTNSF
jgi:XTP/dITP diphosphohydrolase